MHQEADEKQARLAAVVAGQPAAADVRLEYATTLQRATLEIAGDVGQELKVWAYQVTPEGDAAALPMQVDVQCGDQSRQVDLAALGGQVIMPLPDGAGRLTVVLTRKET
jgi:hypothetical protein